jgi:hypothetical protein
MRCSHGHRAQEERRDSVDATYLAYLLAGCSSFSLDAAAAQQSEGAEPGNM